MGGGETERRVIDRWMVSARAEEMQWEKEDE